MHPVAHCVNKYQEKFIKSDGKIIADIVHEKFPFKNFPNSLVKSKPIPKNFLSDSPKADRI